MVGRYSDLSVYKEIFKSSDFIKIVSGGILIPVAFVVRNYSIFGLEGEMLKNILLILSTAVNGLPIIWGAVKGIIGRELNVDELVSLALIACLINGNFVEAAVISFIMVLGAFIEEAVSDSARGQVKKLVDLNPETAIVEVNGREELKAVEELEVGETVIVKAGETVPVDGTVISGQSFVNEALLTGEPLPVVKKEGSSVAAGTKNVDGLLKITVSRLSKDSTISKIISIVEGAENSKVKSARIVDQYAAFFTPVIVSIAVLTYVVTRDINRSIAVLVVGCPCSFLLAGPVTTVAAVGRAAKAGIMVKGGHYLEKLAAAGSFFMDKTGTITEGKPEVRAVRPIGKLGIDEVLSLAASIEEGSTHPIADAIRLYAESRSVRIEKAESLTVVPGFGVKGLVQGKAVSVSAGKSTASKGETLVEVTVDGEAVAEIDLFDAPRPGIDKTVAALRKLGIPKITILSGDSEGAVARVAQALGFDHFVHSLKPEEKMAFVQDAKAGSVFVGDGMNDAPSLKAADVGIAMGLGGSALALDTSDIVLMGDNINHLPFLVRLGKRMSRRIKAGIVISLVINTVAVILGSMGMLSPVLGAVTHNIGSIFVVLLASSLIFTKE